MKKMYTGQLTEERPGMILLRSYIVSMRETWNEVKECIDCCKGHRKVKEVLP